MPLVFVHGVANRLGPGYAKGSAMRQTLFQEYLLKPYAQAGGQPALVISPYWGDLGGRMRWMGASLPLGEFEALGLDDATLLDLYTTTAPQAEPDKAARVLLVVAQKSLTQAVDLLWGSAALSGGDEDEAAALATRVHAYAVSHDQPAWLYSVHNDERFLARLEQEVDAFTAAGGGPQLPPQSEPEYESLGFSSAWQALRRGAFRLQAAVKGTIGQQASERIRPPAMRGVAEFLGDVFVYLHDQQAANAIGGVVGSDIRRGCAAKSANDPLIVVAHSMGGNISYDLLTTTLSDVKVDLFVTVGSQVGFFEELKLFTGSDPALPSPSVPRLPLPANVTRWINIFDYSDLLGFSLESIIDGVEDFHYQTGSLLKAHSHYFVQPTFHARLAARVHGKAF